MGIYVKKEIQVTTTGEKWPFESNLKICQQCALNLVYLCSWVTSESFARVCKWEKQKVLLIPQYLIKQNKAIYKKKYQMIL